MRNQQKFFKHFSKLEENIAADKTLANNIASSDITDLVLMLMLFFMGGTNLKFSFIFKTKNKILAEIRNQDNKKAGQESDITVKIIKGNIDIFFELFFITSIIRYLMRLYLQNKKMQI